MQGYVRNISRTWRHALKRSIAPGQKIDLDVLYAEYGEKHDIAEGKPFADWLRNVKLKDAGTWEISFREAIDIPEDDEMEIQEVQSTPVAEEVNRPINVSPFVEQKPEVMDIVNLSVRKAKEELTRVTDLKLLKHAMNIAKTQAGKDTLTNMLRKRIKELEVFSRR